MSTSSQTTHADHALLQLLAGPEAASGDGDAALGALDADHRAVEMVVARVAADAVGAALASEPRPVLTGTVHPARLLLHAMSRQYRYDGTPTDLAADYLEALDGCLARGAVAWSAVAATTWTMWLCHQGEAASGWAVAQALLTRYPKPEPPALLLASFAALAERSGAVELAAPMWEAARLHHDTVQSARTRWFVEFEYARVHLLQSAGAPGRAAVLLDRVQVGLQDATDSPARLLRFNACLEQAFALTFVGRPDAALASTERCRAWPRDDEAEFEPWLRGVEALAHAAAGRPDDAERALEDVDAAATDTTTLELGAMLPARALIDGGRGDVVALRSTLAAARIREHERVVDAEQRVIWRLIGAWALIRADRRSAAVDLVAELEGVLRSTTPPLPAYEAQVALLRTALDDDPAGHRRAIERCAEHGITVPPGAADPWGLVPMVVPRTLTAAVTRVSGLDVRIDILDGLRISIDGAEASDEMWQRRRKSQVLLALLLAFDGRVSRDELVDTLWAGEALDAATGQSRLSTVLSSLRRALPGTSASLTAGARVVKLHTTQVELQLASGDVTDRALLRDLVSVVGTEDRHDAAAFERRASELVRLVRGEPLRGLDGGPLLSRARELLRRDMAGACAAVLDRWLVASAVTRHEPTAVLIELATHATRLQPLDEQLAVLEVELSARAGRIGTASRAFHRYRELLDDELGLPPSADFVRRHAALVADA
ncbi:MAG: hypothetical protein H7287_03670 [Thermoleophilia bacterium]|nr:hypothetical protein [Thermoleophilia bacterium]